MGSVMLGSWRQELTNRIEQLSKVILGRKCDVRGGKLWARGNWKLKRGRFVKFEGGGSKKTENGQLNVGEIPAHQPSSSSWETTNPNEQRRKVRGGKNYKCYETYGDRNYPYNHPYDYSETWVRDNSYRQPPSKSEANRTFRTPRWRGVKFHEIRLVFSGGLKF